MRFRKLMRISRFFGKMPLLIFAIPFVVVIRLIRPWLLIRCGDLVSQRVGAFAAITELYLCKWDAGINMPKQRHVDIFFMKSPVCNQQLANMWKRVLHVWPAWILSPIYRVNSLISGGATHEIINAEKDRDIYNLLDQYPPHLKFTKEEEIRGEARLRTMGIPPGALFVCLIVRDHAYLRAQIPLVDWNYHNYRDSNIQNYILAAERLADRGYFVIRMGAKVHEPIKSRHPRVIDYATNGMRDDFMDIYLGAKCAFCISSGTGFDAVPNIFRRPIVCVDHVSLADTYTFSNRYIAITKKHWLREKKRFMTFREIFASGAAYFATTKEYEDAGIELRGSTPDEISAVVTEMDSRLNGTWIETEEDNALQKQFWQIFPKSKIHKEFRSRIGADFLRKNRALLV